VAIQLATTTRNARLDAIETDAGTAAILKIRTGAQPATCATADSGTVLISYTLASDWAAAAASGAKSFNNLPLSGAATGTGTAGHFRLYKSDGTTCIMQGSITATGGGGDMTVDNTSVATSQTVNVTAFTITDANS
jgi:hypothetical protein